MTELLVTTAWLGQHLHDPTIRIFDTRWILGQVGEGHRQYLEGHIPGAIHLDIDTQLSGKDGPGRHPFPAKRDFERLMKASGVSRDIHVIIYDAGQGVPAPRLWWLLRYFGHGRVSVLDGGWNRWVQEEQPITQEIPQPAASDFVGRARLKWVLDKEGVDNCRDDPDVLLLDARAPERYRGETEPIDAKAGHIPGAENFPFTSTLNPQTGFFRSQEELKKEFEKIGAIKASKVVCYCGSGITACTNLLALNLIGIDGVLYEGSWSDWSSDNNLSIATKL